MAQRFPPHLAALAATLVLVGGAAAFAMTASLLRPARPTDLAVTETASTQVRVSWRPVVTADHYRVSVTRPLHDVISQRANGTEAAVGGLRPGSSYRLRVTAIDERRSQPDLASTSSAPITVRTAAADAPTLLPPTSPTVIQPATTSLSVGWEPVPRATSYEVQATRHDGLATPVTTSSPIRRAVIIGLDAATDYDLRIRALGRAGASSNWTPPLAARTILASDPVPLAVGTYNVKCHSCGGPSWRSRRFGVAATIASRGLDVVGLQEAQQSGGPQFRSLLRTLNRLQPGWAITSSKVDGTLGTRIIYNTHTVRLLRSGDAKYEHQGNTRHFHQRFYVWGLFQQRTSGKRFWFVNTHIDPNSLPTRVEQGEELAHAIERRRSRRPIIAVGDFNADQFKMYAVHRAMTSAGLIDPLAVTDDSHRVGRGATAERRIHTNFDSFNGFDSKPRRDVGRRKNGKYIDYIFTSRMRVLEFENVVNLDSSGRYRRAASDHNMLRAIVGLP